MVITLDPKLEAALEDQAKQMGITTEALALNTLRERFLFKAELLEPRDEWERRLLEAAQDCGVSLSNWAVSSEGLYD